MAWKSLEDSSSEENECDSEEMPEPDQFLAELEGQASSSRPQKPDKATKAEEKRESKKQGSMRRKKEEEKHTHSLANSPTVRPSKPFHIGGVLEGRQISTERKSDDKENQPTQSEFRIPNLHRPLSC